MKIVAMSDLHGSTKHYNVSIKNEKYEPVYNPLTIEI